MKLSASNTMPRPKRIGQAGFYHIINRGVDKRKIFLDDPDHLRFLHMVHEQSTLFGFDIRAYCLMPNHYHLLLEMKDGSLSLIMKHIDQHYTQYFNKKYNRVGTLWQGRFKSWYISDERYLTMLITYIEQNPIKAGLCTHLGEYPWSTTTEKGSDPAH